MTIIGGAWTLIDRVRTGAIPTKKHFSEFGGTPTVDNAEPRLLETDKAWLAGIFDGKGCIAFGKCVGKKRPYIGFHITNSDLSLLGKCQMIIQNIIKRPIKLLNKKGYSFSLVKTNLKIYTIDLRKQQEIYDILKMIEPYLTAKWRKVKLVLDFLEVRLKERKQVKYCTTFSPTSERLLRYVVSNWSGVTTERKALREEMKPQSELYGNIQRLAEMTDPPAMG